MCVKRMSSRSCLGRFFTVYHPYIDVHFLSALSLSSLILRVCPCDYCHLVRSSRISFLELYNDTMYDLLSTLPDPSPTTAAGSKVPGPAPPPSPSLRYMYEELDLKHKLIALQTCRSMQYSPTVFCVTAG